MLNTSNASELFVFVWLLLWTIKAGYSIFSSGKHSVSFVILTHFVFCGIPAILDLLIAPPIYITYPSFQAMQDPTTNIVYAVYVSGCPVLWWRYGRCRALQPQRDIQSPKTPVPRRLPRRFRFLLYLFAVGPLLAFFCAPDKSIYSTYGGLINSTMTDEMVHFQTIISGATIMSVFAVAGIIAISKRPWLMSAACLPVIFVSIWLNGKRHIVLLAIVLLLITFWDRKVLSGWKLLIVCFAAIAGFGWFSYSYQTSIRSMNVVGALKQYDDFRIDYGRDHGIKYAIYCELHPEQPSILQYRGESILFDLVSFVPRSLWPDKPWPYAVYATAADLGIQPESLGWGITTSWLDEAIANFGWIGMAIGPLSLAFVCRLGDSRRTKVTQFLTIAVSCLMLAVQFSAFEILGIAWVLAVMWSKTKSRSNRDAQGLVAGCSFQT
jgi:oligosaccharide repeat unit polymerase